MSVVTVPLRKRVALVAHDRCKPALLAWAVQHRDTLAGHDLVGTGTTGAAAEAALGLPVQKVLSGPLGGDLQIGAMIAEGRVDVLVFFWDPLAAQPHEPDVRALLRVATVWGVPVASNTTEANFLFTSPLLTAGYEKTVPGGADRHAS